MDRALRIPELLGFIFASLDSRSQCACALVRKDWSNVALDVIWKELKSPEPLVSLLAPLRRSESSGYTELSRRIKVEDWKAFQRYSHRVKTLVVLLRDPISFVPFPLSPQVYSEMAQSRPTLTIMPKLTRLEIGIEKPKELMCPLIFMSESVRQLCFDLPSYFAESLGENVSVLFEEVAARMPRLKILDLKSGPSFPAIMVQEHLEALISSLQELEVFNCPLFFATSSIISALSHLPLLRIISFEYPADYGCGQQNDVIPFHPALSHDAFPTLVDLSFSATFEDAVIFLNMEFASNLTILYIHSPQTTSSESIQILLLQLSQRCQHLTKLCLSAVSGAVNAPITDEHGQEIDRITLQTLNPLLDLPKLIHFELSYHRALQLSKSDFEELLSHWPTLETLCLGSDPLFLEPPILTVEVLPIVARYCPNIRCLSLYIDTHIPHSSEIASISVNSAVRLASLERIEFGLSPLAEEDIGKFSLYLSELLSSSCDISALYGISWLLKHDLDALRFTLDAEEGMHWDRAKWAISLLVEARKQERFHALDMERESKDLALRLAILEEQRRMAIAVARAPSGNDRTCVHQ